MSKLKKYWGYLPLLILCCLEINTLYAVFHGDVVLSWQHYVGIAGLVIVLAALLVKSVYISLLTLALLIMATCMLACFTPAIISFSFGWGSGDLKLSITFQLYYFLLLVLFALLNKPFIKALIREKKIAWKG